MCILYLCMPNSLLPSPMQRSLPQVKSEYKRTQSWAIAHFFQLFLPSLIASHISGRRRRCSPIGLICVSWSHGGDVFPREYHRIRPQVDSHNHISCHHAVIIIIISNSSALSPSHTTRPLWNHLHVVCCWSVNGQYRYWFGRLHSFA